MIEDYSKPWYEIWPEHATKTGQPKRTLPQEVSTTIFRYRAKHKHGAYKYNYSKSIYTKALNKLTITCPVHGDFDQVANEHLQGKGCSRCAGNTKSNTLEFILKAIAIHKDKYNYQYVEYKGKSSHVTIECPMHGKFNQTADGHLSGRGCSVCGGSARSSTEEFNIKAVAVHGKRYDYSKVNYVRSSDKVTIICLEHGPFSQEATSHLMGHGCQYCAGNAKGTTEEFIVKADNVHGNRYDYSEVDYVAAHDKVRIRCREHGLFLKTAGNHLQGKGCPNCSHKVPDYVYLLHVYENIFKIGISSDVVQRIKRLQRSSNSLNLGTITLVANSEQIPNAREIESLLHEKYSTRPDLGDIKFDGYTELRELTTQEALDIKEYLEGLKNVGI